MDNGDWWHAEDVASDGSEFDVWLNDTALGRVAWGLLGDHNVSNGLAAIAASRHAGVEPAIAIQALARFGGVKRRLEVIARVDGVTVYDDLPTIQRPSVRRCRACVTRWATKRSSPSSNPERTRCRWARYAMN